MPDDPVRCPDCHGAGENRYGQPCMTCAGSGAVPRAPYHPPPEPEPEAQPPLWFRLLIGAVIGAAFGVAGAVVGYLLLGAD